MNTRIKDGLQVFLLTAGILALFSLLYLLPYSGIFIGIAVVTLYSVAAYYGGKMRRH